MNRPPNEDDSSRDADDSVRDEHARGSGPPPPDKTAQITGDDSQLPSGPPDPDKTVQDSPDWR